MGFQRRDPQPKATRRFWEAPAFEQGVHQAGFGGAASGRGSDHEQACPWFCMDPTQGKIKQVSEVLDEVIRAFWGVAEVLRRGGAQTPKAKCCKRRIRHRSMPDLYQRSSAPTPVAPLGSLEEESVWEHCLDGVGPRLATSGRTNAKHRTLPWARSRNMRGSQRDERESVLGARVFVTMDLAHGQSEGPAAQGVTSREDVVPAFEPDLKRGEGRKKEEEEERERWEGHVL